MKRAYLFAYNSDVGTREEVRAILDKMTTVETWRFDMLNAFYILSSYSANELAQEFEQIRGTNGRYIFLEHTANSQGRLTEESWYLLNNKQHKIQ